MFNQNHKIPFKLKNDVYKSSPTAPPGTTPNASPPATSSHWSFKLLLISNIVATKVTGLFSNNTVTSGEWRWHNQETRPKTSECPIWQGQRTCVVFSQQGSKLLTLASLMTTTVSTDCSLNYRNIPSWPSHGVALFLHFSKIAASTRTPEIMRHFKRKSTDRQMRFKNTRVTHDTTMALDTLV